MYRRVLPLLLTAVLLLSGFHKAHRGPCRGGTGGPEPRHAPHRGQKPCRRFSPWSCVHLRSGVPQWRALLHQQCSPALCSLRKDESRGLRISSVSVRGMIKLLRTVSMYKTAGYKTATKFVRNLCTARNTWIIWTKCVSRVHFITLNQSPRLEV